MTDFSPFVGIPYVDKGRDYSGADCWGLKWIVYRDVLGIELPSYSESYVTGADRVAMARLITGELDEWIEVSAGDERPFDGVLMREGAFLRHIGVVTTPGRLLHVQPGMTSCIERYRAGLLANRVVGFYRYRDHE